MRSINLPYIISLTLSAPLFAIYLLTLILLINNSSYSIFNTVLFFVLGIIFLGILPTAPIIIDVKSGKTDIFVFEKEKRFKFFIIAIASYTVGTLLFLIMKNYELFLFLLCYTTVTSAIALSTLFTKSSVHTAGIAGPVTYMVMMYGIKFLALFILLIPVSWARWISKAHTFKQLLIGAILSILVTALTIHIYSLCIAVFQFS